MKGILDRNGPELKLGFASRVWPGYEENAPGVSLPALQACIS